MSETTAASPPSTARIGRPASGGRAQQLPSLRRLVAAWAIASGVIVVAVTSALALTTTLQRASLDVVRRDTTSVGTVEAIERQILVHDRLSQLLRVTGDPEIAAAREAQEREIRASVRRAWSHVGSDREADLLASVEQAIDAMFEERAALDQRGARLRESVPALAGALDRIERATGALRGFNAAEVRAAHAGARRVDDLSTVAAAVAALTLLPALGLLLFGLHRLVLRPLDAVHVAIGRARRGERDVRVEETGSREIAEIARAVNDANAALERQHEDRLAFLGGVAHDLRNPLSALKMAVVSARRDMPDDRRLTIAARQIDRLARMIGDLLDATRIEAGDLELDLTTFDVAETAREVVELYRPTTTRHTIDLEVPDGPVLLRGDALRLEQVIANLVTNAVKYSPRGGPVRVRVGRRAGAAEITVSDFGIGIPRSEIADLFSPFRRSAATRSIAPGAGLGLSVVRRIVDAHGGSIEVESTPHVGSAFTIVLPAVDTGHAG